MSVSVLQKRLKFSLESLAKRAIHSWIVLKRFVLMDVCAGRHTSVRQYLSPVGAVHSVFSQRNEQILDRAH